MSPKDVLEAYEARINAHDFDLLVDLIAPEATFWFSDGSHTGHAEIRAAFEATWRLMGDDEKYWLDGLRWIAEGYAAAACTYRFNWKAGGNTGSGRGTTVIALTDAGWRIVHEHLSPFP